MLVGTFQLLQAKQAEIESGVEYITTLRDYWVARSQLEQVQSGRATGIGRNGTSMTSGSSGGASSRGRDAGGH
jgi:hypothetical protein